MNWAAAEFEGLDLEDKRLNQPAVKLAEQLAAKPTASIPGACGGWGETTAEYSFFALEGSDWTDIMVPYWSCARTRMDAHRLVL